MKVAVHTVINVHHFRSSAGIAATFRVARRRDRSYATDRTVMRSRGKAERGKHRYPAYVRPVGASVQMDGQGPSSNSIRSGGQALTPTPISSIIVAAHDLADILLGQPAELVDVGKRVGQPLDVGKSEPNIT